MAVLTWTILVLAAAPCCLFLLNLRAYRRLPRFTGIASEPLSVLIPARNEEVNIRATLEAALASRGAEFEVIVLDDGSTDRTADIVAELARTHPQVRLVRGENVPAGWCGKQYACYQLAQHARHPWLVFLDADVRLTPDALARLGNYGSRSGVDLASGVPRQELGTFLERLLLPLIHFLLLSYLPIPWMRRTSSPAFGAGCGQLFLARAEAYAASGGHAGIRASLHDGLKLPRLFRRAGRRTDLFDATDLASCRMYRSNLEVWQGLTKNAVEGIAAPKAIAPWTVLLLGGQVAPFAWLGYSVLRDGTLLLAAGVLLAVLTYVPRFLACRRFQQPVGSAWLHPIAVLLFLGLQWIALLRLLLRRPLSWKGRDYAPVVDATGIQSLPSAGAKRWNLGRHLNKGAVILSLSLWHTTIAAPTFSASPSQKITSFALRDQHERQHQIRFPRDKIMVVVVADRKGAANVDDWVRPVATRFQGQVDIAGIADLSTVPAFLRNAVRKRFLQDQSYPVMLDWEGSISRRFSYQAGKANVLVLERQGQVRWRAVGKPDERQLKELLELLERLTDAADERISQPPN